MARKKRKRFAGTVEQHTWGASNTAPAARAEMELAEQDAIRGDCSGAIYSLAESARHVGAATTEIFYRGLSKPGSDRGPDNDESDALYRKLRSTVGFVRTQCGMKRRRR